MRRLVIAIAAAAVTTAATSAHAEESTEKPSRDHMLVADLGMHVIGIGYQHMASRWVAGQVALDYYQPWTQNINFLGLSGDSYKGGDLRGMMVRARVFFHPFGAAPTGFWVSPFAQAGIGWGRRNGERLSGPISAAGVSVGYSVMLGSSVMLGGGLGLQIHAARIPGGDGPPRYSRFYPQVEIQLGYVF